MGAVVEDLMECYKKNILFICTAGILLYLSAIVLCYTVDPYCIFHKSIFKNHVFFLSQNLMNRGQIETFLVKTDDYDSILVGTSHTENVYGSELTRVLNSRGTLKLTQGGVPPSMIERVVKKAVSTGKIKNVVYGFELSHFMQPANTWHQSKFSIYDVNK